MQKAPNRDFKKGDKVFVVDWCSTIQGRKAYEMSAEVISVKGSSFLAMLYDESCRVYSFSDYGRLVFDTKLEASNAAEELPKPNSIAYVVDRTGKISRRVVESIWSRERYGVNKLTIEFKNGEFITTDKIGSEVFLSEESAKQSVYEKLQSKRPQKL